jgi:hypothetical protein
VRRRTLLLAAATASVGAPQARADSEALLGLFADRAAAAAIGHAYLASHPSDAASLARSLLTALPGAAPVRVEVAALVRADYATGRIACAGGWILSATEARLCALAALA